MQTIVFAQGHTLISKTTTVIPPFLGGLLLAALTVGVAVNSRRSSAHPVADPLVNVEKTISTEPAPARPIAKAEPCPVKLIHSQIGDAREPNGLGEMHVRKIATLRANGIDALTTFNDFVLDGSYPKALTALNELATLVRFDPQ